MIAIVLALAAARVALHLLLADGYGYTSEELYLLACSERLAWGYTETPPLLAHATLLARIVLGSSLLAVRLGPALAGGVLVILAAALARRLGGGAFATVLTALAVALGPAFVQASSTLGASAYLPLAATAFAYAAVRLHQTGAVRMWIPMGVAAAFLVGFAPAGGVVFAGVVFAWVWLVDRDLVRGLAFFAGAMVAASVAVPSVVWWLAQGMPWPEADIDHGVAVTLAADVLAQPSVVIAPLWVAGLLGLCGAPRLRAARGVGWAAVGLGGWALVSTGGAAVVLPVLPALLAAGAVVFESLTRPLLLAWLRFAAVVLVAGAGIVGLPLAAPLLPLDTLAAYAAHTARGLHWPASPRLVDGLPAHFADMLGWEERVAAVRRAFDAVPPKQRHRVALWVRDKHDAAALDRLGARLGLPRAVSADGDYAGWGTGVEDPELVVAVGFSLADIQPAFRRQCREEVLACATCPSTRRELRLHLCESPRAPASRLWAEWAQP